MDKWVKDSEGMTIAEMSELVKGHFLMGIDYEEVVSSLKDKKIPSSSKYNKEKAVGFKTAPAKIGLSRVVEEIIEETTGLRYPAETEEFKF